MGTETLSGMNISIFKKVKLNTATIWSTSDDPKEQTTQSYHK